MKFNQNQSFARTASYDYNEGLRKYMLGIYNNMAIALVITGIFAMFCASNESFMSMLYTPQGMTGLGTLFAFAPLAFVLFLSFGLHKMQAQTARLVFFAYSAVMGISLSYLFLVYTAESIASTFFITASVFGGMSLYGYTTKKDLTQFGSILFMAVMGILLASLINLFMKSSGFSLLISLVSVVVFTGLVAYDTQKLKAMYFQFSGNEETAAKISIYGALNLYLDFINIFINLLRFLGDRRES